MQYRLLLTAVTFLLFSLVACAPVEKGKTDSDLAYYHYTLGVASLNEQNAAGALKEFLEAEKFDDRDPEIQAGMAQAYLLKRAYDLAEERFEIALKLSDEDPKYNNNLGSLYLTMGRYDDAIIAFQTAADNLLFDRPEMSWAGIGLANVQKQDYPAAERAYRKAMEINPTYYMASFRLGELYYKQDRPVEALDMFTHTVDLVPGFLNARYWLGLVYMKMKEPEAAKKAFLEVIRRDPKSDMARLSRNYLKIINK